MLNEELQKEVQKTQEAIRNELQSFHNRTGLIPVSVDFETIDIREQADSGQRKRILVEGVDLKANT